MADNIKRGPGRPKKTNTPVKIEIEPIVEQVYDNNPKSINIEGVEFMWVNEEKRNRKGWGIWRPVTRDSDLGIEVAKQFVVAGNQFVGNNKESNYFYLGPDTVLGYTTTEARERHRAKAAEKAERQIQALAGEGVTYNRRQVVINLDDRPGKKK